MDKDSGNYVTFKEFNEVINDSLKFKKFLIMILKKAQSDRDIYSAWKAGDNGNRGVPLVQYGSEGGYYWDYTSVELNPDNKTLTVIFNVGSESGYVPTNYTEYNVSIEDFRQYLINRKWEYTDIDTIDIVINSINKIDGVELIREEVDDGY